MKKECSIVRDVLPLYMENMVSEGTAAFVKEHLAGCPDCATELDRLKSGRQIDQTEVPQREKDARAITAVKKKIAKRIVKTVAAVCLVFAVLISGVVVYTGIGYPVTKDNISLSTHIEGGYSYIVLETEAGKSLSFDSKTEDIFNEKNEVCGQRITLYNLQYHNRFSQSVNTMSWGSPIDSESPYIEVRIELEDGTLQVSNAG